MTHKPDQSPPDDRTSLERVANQPPPTVGGLADMTDHQLAAALAPFRQRIEDLERRIESLEWRLTALEAKGRP